MWEDSSIQPALHKCSQSGGCYQVGMRIFSGGGGQVKILVSVPRLCSLLTLDCRLSTTWVFTGLHVSPSPREEAVLTTLQMMARSRHAAGIVLGSRLIVECCLQLLAIRISLHPYLVQKKGKTSGRGGVGAGDGHQAGILLKAQIRKTAPWMPLPHLPVSERVPQLAAATLGSCVIWGVVRARQGLPLSHKSPFRSVYKR